MLKVMLPIFTIALMFSMTIVHGDSAGTINPIDVVPDRANMLMYLDWNKLHDESSSDTDKYGSLPFDQAEQDNFADVLNIISGFNQSLLFADASDTSDNPYYGVIIEGTFIESDFIENSIKHAEDEMTNTYHKDYKIYTDNENTMGVAFLTENELVIGHLEAVKDVIDVKLGYKLGIQGAPIEIYNDLGSAIIKMAATIPETSSLNDGYSTAVFPVQTAYTDIESMGMIMDINGNNITFDMHLFFSNSDSAYEIKQQYEQLMDFMSTMNDMYAEDGMEQLPDELVNFMDITQTDTELEIKMKLSDNEFDSLSDVIIQSMLGSIMPDTSSDPDLGYYDTQDIQPFSGDF